MCTSTQKKWEFRCDNSRKSRTSLTDSVHSLSNVTMIHCSRKRRRKTTAAAAKSNSNCYRFDGFVDQRILPAIDCTLAPWNTCVDMSHPHLYITLKLVSVFHFLCLWSLLLNTHMHVVIVSRSISCQICFRIWHETWHWRHGNASIR